jgi:hypothetical protein
MLVLRPAIAKIQLNHEGELDSVDIIVIHLM